MNENELVNIKYDLIKLKYSDKSINNLTTDVFTHNIKKISDYYEFMDKLETFNIVEVNVAISDIKNDLYYFTYIDKNLDIVNKDKKQLEDLKKNEFKGTMYSYDKSEQIYVERYIFDVVNEIVEFINNLLKENTQYC